MVVAFTSAALSIASPLCHAGASGATPTSASNSWFSEIDTKSLWFDVGILSHHFDHEESHREKNPNLGIEYWFGKDKDYALALGAYGNSEHHTTTYVLVDWAPLHYQQFKIGLTAGFANGYPDVNHGKFSPTLLPLLSFERGPVGLNFTAVPKVGANIDGLVAVQFKFRVGW
jgi:hypothetical protein